VMYDIAFAVMDLEARDSKELGNAFLNTYIEQTGDWLGLQVLPLYLSRQAYVRAKVTSFLLDDAGVPEEAKKAAMVTAADYYKLAWSYTQQRQGKLILMSGLSGSGKTTVARHLARKLGAIQLRSDAVRKHIAGISLQEKGGAEIYSAEMNEKTYNRLLDLAIKIANQGWTVILDAKYDREATRTEAIAQSKQHQLPIEIIHCTAPENVLRDRLTSRTDDISDATSDLLNQQKAATEAFTEAEKLTLKTIDTSENWAAQLL
ncbi:MAG: AAA family ATPase, partial [Coleofasciculaceae cyanobacterium]